MPVTVPGPGLRVRLTQWHRLPGTGAAGAAAVRLGLTRSPIASELLLYLGPTVVSPPDLCQAHVDSLDKLDGPRFGPSGLACHHELFAIVVVDVGRP